jgi:hypothetical protein
VISPADGTPRAAWTPRTESKYEPLWRLPAGDVPELLLSGSLFRLRLRDDLVNNLAGEKPLRFARLGCHLEFVTPKVQFGPSFPPSLVSDRCPCNSNHDDPNADQRNDG